MNNDFALFLGWNRAVAGREMDSIELFGGFMKYVDGLKDAGTIESHEPYFLDYHGGDLNGFWLIRGERAKLDELTETDEWIQWTTKVQYTMEGFGVLRATSNSALQRRMTAFQKNIKK